MNTHRSIPDITARSKVLSVNFNQDQGCFSIGHEKGFIVYNSNPLDLRVRRIFNRNEGGTGIGIASMLYRTNYLALVGGGRNPKFPNNRLAIWDDLKRKSSISLDFMNPILNVLLSRARIVVVLKNQVQLFSFSSQPKKLASYETIDNDIGIADLSGCWNRAVNSDVSDKSLGSDSAAPQADDDKHQILAFPSRSAGQIQLVDVSQQGQQKNAISIIKAHKSKIRCLALNRSGTLVASASETGTIIRVHSTHNTVLVFEFRRGLDRAIITSMKFSHNDSRLAVLSDKSTLHVFNIVFDGPKKEEIDGSFTPDDLPCNRRHMLRNLPSPIPVPGYFKSVWSFCSINTSQYNSELYGENFSDQGVLGWSGNDSIIIVWKNKCIWEKYVIVESNKDSPIPVDTKKGFKTWQLVRFGWKFLEI